MSRVPVSSPANPGSKKAGFLTRVMSPLPFAHGHDSDKAPKPEAAETCQQQQDALQEDTSEDAESTAASLQTVCFFDYHIVYLPSYSVPVLLLRGYSAGRSHVATAHHPLLVICFVHISRNAFWLV